MQNGRDRKNGAGSPGFLSHYMEALGRCGGSTLPSLEALKLDYIRYLLTHTDSDIKRAADILSVPSIALSRTICKHRLLESMGSGLES